MIFSHHQLSHRGKLIQNGLPERWHTQRRIQSVISLWYMPKWRGMLVFKIMWEIGKKSLRFDIRVIRCLHWIMLIVDLTYFPWGSRGKNVFHPLNKVNSTRLSWPRSLRMFGTNLRLFFPSSAKEQYSLIKNICFGRVREDIRHSRPKKSSFLASISDEIGRLLKGLSHMSDLVWLERFC